MPGRPSLGFLGTLAGKGAETIQPRANDQEGSDLLGLAALLNCIVF